MSGAARIGRLLGWSLLVGASLLYLRFHFGMLLSPPYGELQFPQPRLPPPQGSGALALILLAGLAGGLMAAAIQNVPLIERIFQVDDSLRLVAIVVIGGTSLLGGEGAMWRTAIGLLIIATLTNVFDSLAISTNYQLVAKGAIVIGAVALDLFARSLRT